MIDTAYEPKAQRIPLDVHLTPAESELYQSIE